MPPRPLLLALLITGCAPASAVLDPAGEEPSEGTAEDGLVDAGAADDGADPSESDGDPGESGDGADDSPEDDEPAPTDVVDSGTWQATAASIEDDPCQFDQYLSTYLRLGISELLPTAFAVEGDVEGFQIEALDYGAEGPIDCAVDADGAFDCEDQFVAPLDYGLGDLGWVYQVRYFGVVESAGRLRGEAVVDYPSIDGDTAWVLDAVGLDISACTQTFFLELQLDG
jgi:hypothetical protein